MAKKKKVVEDFVFLTKLPQRLLDFLVTWLHLDYDDLLIIKHLVEHEEVYREVRLPKGNGEQRVLFLTCPNHFLQKLSWL